jgi:hypothetical protein
VTGQRFDVDNDVGEFRQRPTTSDWRLTTGDRYCFNHSTICSRVQ